MRILGKQVLDEFKKEHADAQASLESWEAVVTEAQWKNPHDLKNRYPKASVLGNQVVIFDICRNLYRMLTKINYKSQLVLVKKIGTHKEYDRWRIN